MHYKITIRDEDGTDPIDRATVTFESAAGAQLASLMTTANGTIELDTEFDGPLFVADNRMTVSADGYYSFSLTVASLLPDSEFWLIKKPVAIRPLFVIAAISALAWWIAKS